MPSRTTSTFTVGSAALLRQVAVAAGQGWAPGPGAHLEADTGMGRGGATATDWPDLVAAARAAEAEGLIKVVGLWSHIACADIPGHPAIDRQLTAFRAAVDHAERAGIKPEVRHLANGPATLSLPQSYFDLVRPGGPVVGLCTTPGGVPDWLRPAMTVRARLIQVKRAPAGTPRCPTRNLFETKRDATIGVLPLRLQRGRPADSPPNQDGLLWTRGRRVPIAGTVNLNHLMLNLGDQPAEEGDEVILFGPGDQGEPTAQEWADQLGTISYEIVTRFTGKVPRTYSGVTGTGSDLAVDGRADGQVAAAH